MARASRRAIFLLVALSLVSCRPHETGPQVLRVGYVPSENVQQVGRDAQPIVALLEEKLSMEVQSFVATDYTGVVEALHAEKLDIAFLTPASYVLAQGEARVKVILKSHPAVQPLLLRRDHRPDGKRYR